MLTGFLLLFAFFCELFGENVEVCEAAVVWTSKKRLPESILSLVLDMRDEAHDVVDDLRAFSNS
jgi:hypothetical protein